MLSFKSLKYFPNISQNRKDLNLLHAKIEKKKMNPILNFLHSKIEKNKIILEWYY